MRAVRWRQHYATLRYVAHIRSLSRTQMKAVFGGLVQRHKLKRKRVKLFYNKLECSPAMLPTVKKLVET